MGIDGQDYYAAAGWLQYLCVLKKVPEGINPKWPSLMSEFSERDTCEKAVRPTGGRDFRTFSFRTFLCGRSICKGIARLEELRICIIAPFLNSSYSKTD